jgi:PhnB protein
MVMKNISPYLHFPGNAEEAMNFYRAAFGGTFLMFQRYRDIPGGEKMPPSDQEKLIHVSLQVTPFFTLMASDSMEGDEVLRSGDNYHICIHTDSEGETNKLFDALCDGGHVEMPLNKTFWGAYFGMCTDKFGIRWMLNYLQEPK